jgi:hypothetical protein
MAQALQRQAWHPRLLVLSAHYSGPHREGARSSGAATAIRRLLLEPVERACAAVASSCRLGLGVAKSGRAEPERCLQALRARAPLTVAKRAVD